MNKQARTNTIDDFKAGDPVRIIADKLTTRVISIDESENAVLVFDVEGPTLYAPENLELVERLSDLVATKREKIEKALTDEPTSITDVSNYSGISVGDIRFAMPEIDERLEEIKASVNASFEREAHEDRTEER